MPRKYVFWTEEQRVLLAEMVKEGKSKAEIYEKLKCHSVYSIKHMLRKLGLCKKIERGMNKYITLGGTTKIILQDMEGNVHECLIDTDDMEFVLSCGRWHVAQRGKSTYATVGICRKDHYLHRLIMDCPKGMLVDHINGNTLDCRKANLRIVTPAQNGQNQHRLSEQNHSGYRGVSWCKIHKKWRAVIKVNKKQIGNKYFDDKEQAHQYVVALRAKYMPYSSDARGIINL